MHGKVWQGWSIYIWLKRHNLIRPRKHCCHVTIRSFCYWNQWPILKSFCVHCIWMVKVVALPKFWNSFAILALSLLNAFLYIVVWEFISLMPAQRNKYHFVAKNNIERKITIITIEVTPPHQFYPGWLKRSKRGKIYSTCVSFCEVRLLIYHYLGNQQSKDLKAHNYIFGIQYSPHLSENFFCRTMFSGTSWYFFF